MDVGGVALGEFGVAGVGLGGMDPKLVGVGSGNAERGGMVMGARWGMVNWEGVASGDMKLIGVRCCRVAVKRLDQMAG